MSRVILQVGEDVSEECDSANQQDKCYEMLISVICLLWD
jgi:hypothetical protein